MKGRDEISAIYMKDTVEFSIDQFAAALNMMKSEIHITVRREDTADDTTFDCLGLSRITGISAMTEYFQRNPTSEAGKHKVHVVAPPGPLGVYVDKSADDRLVIKGIPDPPPKLLKGEFKDGDIILAMKGSDDMSTIEMKDSKGVTLEEFASARSQIKSAIELTLLREDGSDGPSTPEELV